MRIGAVILAGGGGMRLGGVVKATLRVGGISLIARVSSALGDVERPILVAHGGLDPGRLGLDARHVAVADPPEIAGPLAGLAAAAAWWSAQGDPPDAIVSVAVDTPFLPKRFAIEARDALGAGNAVIAAYDGQAYPTNALWRLSSLRSIPPGNAGIRDFAASIAAVEMNWPASDGGNPFANLNTVADLLALGRRAAMTQGETG